MRRQSRFSLLAVPVVVVAAALSACGSPPQPVGIVSADPAAITLPHSSWQPLTITWRMRAPLAGVEGEPRVSLHLIDGAGELQRTFDHPFPDSWREGEEVTYRVPLFQSTLGPPLELGEYQLAAGLYDAAGHRWPVAVPGDRSAHERVPIAKVRAVESGEGFPELSFSAEWLPVEPGEDRQILARRWLAGDGAIRVRGITAPGALWLRLGIPGGSELQEVMLGEGADQQKLTVASECSGFEAEIAGVGSHTVEIPLAPEADAPGECRISFRANFALTSMVNREKKTIALENLAWGSG